MQPLKALLVGLALILPAMTAYAQAPQNEVPTSGAVGAPRPAAPKAEQVNNTDVAAKANSKQVAQEAISSSVAGRALGATNPGGSGIGTNSSPASQTISTLENATRAQLNQALTAPTVEERRTAAATANDLAKAAQATLTGIHQEQSASRWLGGGVLGTAFAVLLLVVLADGFRQKLAWDSAIYRLFGLTIVVFSAIFLVVTGYSETQIAPVMGLLGTALGYILGKESPGVSASLATTGVPAAGAVGNGTPNPAPMLGIPPTRQ